MNDIKLLDCTLRDGGYYTDWEFSNILVKNLIYNLKPGLVDVVELGYRKRSNIYRGKYFFTDENSLNDFNFFNSQSYAVMIDFADVKDNSIKIIDDLLPVDSSGGIIDIVRVACNPDDCNHPTFNDTVTKILSKGYRVCINIMKCSILTKDIVHKLTETLNHHDLLAIYFADSYGSLTSKIMIDIFSDITTVSDISLGFHGHDNMGCAFSNTLLAVDLGFKYIDGTILGMGRGAGNTDLETLCLHFNKFENRLDQLNFSNLGECFFKSLKNRYNWGYSKYYHLAANNNIHPSYIQFINNNKTLKSHEIINIIDILIDNDCNNFDKEFIIDQIKKYE